MSRAEEIKGYMRDVVSAFVYYDRTEDEDLPLGAIEEAVAQGEITVKEIAEAFEQELNAAVKAPDEGVAK